MPSSSYPSSRRKKFKSQTKSESTERRRQDRPSPASRPSAWSEQPGAAAPHVPVVASKRTTSLSGRSRSSSGASAAAAAATNTTTTTQSSADFFDSSSSGYWRADFDHEREEPWVANFDDIPSPPASTTDAPLPQVRNTGYSDSSGTNTGSTDSETRMDSILDASERSEDHNLVFYDPPENEDDIEGSDEEFHDIPIEEDLYYSGAPDHPKYKENKDKDGVPLAAVAGGAATGIGVGLWAGLFYRTKPPREEGGPVLRSAAGLEGLGEESELGMHGDPALVLAGASMLVGRTMLATTKAVTESDELDDGAAYQAMNNDQGAGTSGAANDGGGAAASSSANDGGAAYYVQGAETSATTQDYGAVYVASRSGAPTGAESGATSHDYGGAYIAGNTGGGGGGGGQGGVAAAPGQSNSASTNSMAAQAATAAAGTVGAAAAAAAGVAAAGTFGAAVAVGIGLGVASGIAASIAAGVVVSNNRRDSVLRFPTTAPTITSAPSPLDCQRPDIGRDGITIDTYGLNRAIADDETPAVEEAFVVAYNRVNDGCFDEYKRLLQNATLTSQSSKQDEDGEAFIAVTFDVEATCSGCRRDGGLWDDVSPMQSGNSDAFSEGTRFLKEQFDGFIFISEFLSEYNLELDKLKVLGKIERSFDFVAYSGGRRTWLPTSQPSASPSYQPSSKQTSDTSPSSHPSSNPTAKPTPRPTFRPTRPGETKSPTNSPAPTRFPTRRPVEPTPFPSPSPSEEPTFPIYVPSLLKYLPTFPPTLEGETFPPTTRWPTRAPITRPPTAIPSIVPTKVGFSRIPTYSPKVIAFDDLPRIPSLSHMPTQFPTRNPNSTPPPTQSSPPSMESSLLPSSAPVTPSPTRTPTEDPTPAPSKSPSKVPTPGPSPPPSPSPTTQSPQVISEPATPGPTGVERTLEPVSVSTEPPVVRDESDGSASSVNSSGQGAATNPTPRPVVEQPSPASSDSSSSSTPSTITYTPFAWPQAPIPAVSDSPTLQPGSTKTDVPIFSPVAPFSVVTESPTPQPVSKTKSSETPSLEPSSTTSSPSFSFLFDASANAPSSSPSTSPRNEVSAMPSNGIVFFPIDLEITFPSNMPSEEMSALPSSSSDDSTESSSESQTESSISPSNPSQTPSTSESQPFPGLLSSQPSSLSSQKASAAPSVAERPDFVIGLTLTRNPSDSTHPSSLPSNPTKIDDEFNTVTLIPSINPSVSLQPSRVSSPAQAEVADGVPFSLEPSDLSAGPSTMEPIEISSSMPSADVRSDVSSQPSLVQGDAVIALTDRPTSMESAIPPSLPTSVQPTLLISPTTLSHTESVSEQDIETNSIETVAPIGMSPSVTNEPNTDESLSLLPSFDGWTERPTSIMSSIDDLTNSPSAPPSMSSQPTEFELSDSTSSEPSPALDMTDSVQPSEDANAGVFSGSPSQPSATRRPLDEVDSSLQPSSNAALQTSSPSELPETFEPSLLEIEVDQATESPVSGEPSLLELPETFKPSLLENEVDQASPASGEPSSLLSKMGEPSSMPTDETELIASSSSQPSPSTPSVSHTLQGTLSPSASNLSGTPTNNPTRSTGSSLRPPASQSQAPTKLEESTGEDLEEMPVESQNPTNGPQNDMSEIPSQDIPVSTFSISPHPSSEPSTRQAPQDTSQPLTTSVEGLSSSPTKEASDMMITGVIDGPLSGGNPKAIEFFVRNDIDDLSVFSFGSQDILAAMTFRFPQDTAKAGDYVYLSFESELFQQFFGYQPTYVGDAASGIDGNEAFQLYLNGVPVDVFGVLGDDGRGQPWEYTNGWAYKKDGFGPTTAFNDAQWFYSGVDALTGKSLNEDAPVPFPALSYSPLVVESLGPSNEFSSYPSDSVRPSDDPSNFPTIETPPSPSAVLSSLPTSPPNLFASSSPSSLSAMSVEPGQAVSEVPSVSSNEETATASPAYELSMPPTSSSTTGSPTDGTSSTPSSLNSIPVELSSGAPSISQNEVKSSETPSATAATGGPVAQGISFIPSSSNTVTAGPTDEASSTPSSVNSMLIEPLISASEAPSETPNKGETSESPSVNAPTGGSMNEGVSFAPSSLNAETTSPMEGTASLNPSISEVKSSESPSATPTTGRGISFTPSSSDREAFEPATTRLPSASPSKKTNTAFPTLTFSESPSTVATIMSGVNNGVSSSPTSIDRVSFEPAASVPSESIPTKTILMSSSPALILPSGPTTSPTNDNISPRITLEPVQSFLESPSLVPPAEIGSVSPTFQSILSPSSMPEPSNAISDSPSVGSNQDSSAPSTPKFSASPTSMLSASPTIRMDTVRPLYDVSSASPSFGNPLLEDRVISQIPTMVPSVSSSNLVSQGHLSASPTTTESSSSPTGLASISVPTTSPSQATHAVVDQNPSFSPVLDTSGSLDSGRSSAFPTIFSGPPQSTPPEPVLGSMAPVHSDIPHNSVLLFSTSSSVHPSTCPTAQPSKEKNPTPLQPDTTTIQNEPSAFPTESTKTKQPSQPPSKGQLLVQPPSNAKTLTPTRQTILEPNQTTSSETAKTIPPLPKQTSQPQSNKILTKRPTGSLHPSVYPSFSLSDVPSISPSASPSDLPSVAASADPSVVPSNAPSVVPTVVASGFPSSIPSDVPSVSPSASPSDLPSVAASADPSVVPSNAPSVVPTVVASGVPSSIPSDVPSVSPSASPSDLPSVAASADPSVVPSNAPSVVPTVVASSVPSSIPSDVPSVSPSASPSDLPSVAASADPSVVPSNAPSVVPTVVASGFPSASVEPSVFILGSISGYVFEDTDNDDSDDAPLENVLILLLDRSGGNQLLATTVTDSEGFYVFTDLPVGTYSILEVNPVNYVDVTDADGPIFGSSVDDLDSQIVGIELAAGENKTDQNFTDERLRVITGQVLEDTDNDGLGDEGIPNVTIELLAPNGTVLAETLTTPDGNFTFTGVVPNDENSVYTLKQQNLAGFVDVDDSDGTTGGTSLSELLVDVSEGDSNDNLFFDEVGSTSPSSGPSFEQSTNPSFIPSIRPSIEASGVPSSIPSDVPSVSPSASPSDLPSVGPSADPSVVPSSAPSVVPTVVASSVPSSIPSDVPSVSLSASPSDLPSCGNWSPYSVSPSASIPPPIVTPGAAYPTPGAASPPQTLPPTFQPSVYRSQLPSNSPSSLPSFSPTAQPSSEPSLSPTQGDCVETIDFSVRGDGSVLNHGDYVGTEWFNEYGMTVSASGVQATTPQGSPRIFLTTNNETVSVGGIRRLRSPHRYCPVSPTQSPTYYLLSNFDNGAAGRGIEGRPDKIGANCIPQGNALIVQSDSKTVPYASNTSGTISFTFNPPIPKFEFVTLLNVYIGTTNTIEVTQGGPNGLVWVLPVNALGRNAFHNVVVDIENVSRVDVNLAGETAVTSIGICPNHGSSQRRLIESEVDSTMKVTSEGEQTETDAEMHRASEEQQDRDTLGYTQRKSVEISRDDEEEVTLNGNDESECRNGPERILRVPVDNCSRAVLEPPIRIVESRDEEVSFVVKNTLSGCLRQDQDGSLAWAAVDYLLNADDEIVCEGWQHFSCFEESKHFTAKCEQGFTVIDLYFKDPSLHQTDEPLEEKEGDIEPSSASRKRKEFSIPTVCNSPHLVNPRNICHLRYLIRCGECVGKTETRIVGWKDRLHRWWRSVFR